MNDLLGALRTEADTHQTAHDDDRRRKALFEKAADEIERLQGLGCEPMRVIAVEAIREITSCADLKCGDLYLSELLMKKTREYIGT